MISYLFLFLVFGIIGWAIDSAYCSITSKRLESRTHLLFFSSVYAIGGIILVMIYKNINTHFWLQLGIAVVALTLLELLSGIFSERIMKRRYWDYSDNRWNYKGYIDVLHICYWLVLAALFKVAFSHVLI